MQWGLSLVLLSCIILWVILVSVTYEALLIKDTVKFMPMFTFLCQPHAEDIFLFWNTLETFAVSKNDAQAILY